MPTLLSRQADRQLHVPSIWNAQSAPARSVSWIEPFGCYRCLPMKPRDRLR